MRKARLLSTVAVTLLFAAGAASAQSMKKDESPAASPPAAQQKAPAEKVAPPMTQSQGKPAVKPETTGQAPKAGDAGAPSKGAMDSDSKKSEPAAKSGTMDKAAPPAKSTMDKAAPAAKSTDSGKSGVSGSSTTTTGQGAASGSAKLSTEQRTKITTVIKQQKVERVEPSKLNISISVGAKVPTSVRFYPLPVEVITIYPEWRGYDYILVGDEILVINPRTHEIVAILEA